MSYCYPRGTAELLFEAIPKLCALSIITDRLHPKYPRVRTLKPCDIVNGLVAVYVKEMFEIKLSILQANFRIFL
jgi:hypothetical protein